MTKGKCEYFSSKDTEYYAVVRETRASSLTLQEKGVDLMDGEAGPPWIDAFPYCCGIDVLTELSSTLPDFRAAVADRIKQAIIKDTGIMLAVTNHEDQAQGEIALQANGFRKLLDFHNPREESFLTLWICDPGKNIHQEYKK